MAKKKNTYLVTIEENATTDSVSENLFAAAKENHESIDITAQFKVLGVLSISCSAAFAKAAAKVEGVQNIEREKTVRIAPPGSKIQ